MPGPPAGSGSHAGPRSVRSTLGAVPSVKDPPVLLADLTTIGLGGPARGLVQVTEPDQVPAAVADGPVLVIGGGSNLVVADAGIDATVVRIAIPGLRADGDRVRIGAGEDWDATVAVLVADGYCGLAPLSGIPGSCGATPVQNVGAYGTEIADLLESVTLYDRRERHFATVAAADLGLTYRGSVLRGTDRAVITSLTLRLGRRPTPVRYPELAAALGVRVGQTAPEGDVRAAVLALRRAKGMVLDPGDPDTRSVGSFFTNPILDGTALAVADAAIRDRLGTQVSYPRYPVAGTAGTHRSAPLTKLSAAWLIERAGFPRGFPGAGRRVRISTKHSLALVNAGGSTTELLELAEQIRAGVARAFAVDLIPEPLLIGGSQHATDRAVHTSF